MKIVSWNCKGKFREKFTKISQFDADIYVIQECEDPKRSKSISYIKWCSNNYFWIGDDKNRGLGIFFKSSINAKLLNWDSLCLKYFLPISVNEEFNILAVRTQPHYIEEYYIYQQLNKDKYDKNLIIIGDFNSSKTIDDKYVTRKDRGHDITVEELEKIGLVDAYHYFYKEKQGKETKNTFYLHSNPDKGHHIDHCFICPSNLKEILIDDRLEWLKYSDHIPLILEAESKSKN